MLSFQVSELLIDDEHMLELEDEQDEEEEGLGKEWNWQQSKNKFFKIVFFFPHWICRTP